MLGSATFVLGHQESIAAINLTLNATNGWFKVDLAILQKKNNDILGDFFFQVYEYMMYSCLNYSC